MIGVSEASSEPVINDVDLAGIVNACLDRCTDAQLIAYTCFHHSTNLGLSQGVQEVQEKEKQVIMIHV